MHRYLAKTFPRETIQEHTDNLLKNFEVLKSLYPNIKGLNWDILYYACLYHDLGKMNVKFYNKIVKVINEKYDGNLDFLEDKYPNIEEIPHGYLSGAFIPVDFLKETFEEVEIKILYEAIYYHHNREKLEGDRITDLKTIIENDLEEYYKDFDYDKLLAKQGLNTRFRKYLKTRILNDSKYKSNTNIFNSFVLVKGLLNKIDFAASSDVIVEKEPEDVRVLAEESIKKWGLNSLQEYMKEHENENLIIKASTGIGKTEGALVWIGKNKGFFTLPLKVSINSIYDRVVDKLKCPNDKVALLHSDTASEYLKRSKNNELDGDYLDSTKQLTVPLTVCTVDQLIGFIFKYEGFELKLATLAYSKTVIDEIQMYSADLIGYLIVALKYINDIGGKFAIVTATFPPIFEKAMEFAGFKEGIDYIKPNKPFLKEVDGKTMLRHKVKVYKEKINTDYILADKRKKKLIIVNTIKEAQRIYEELKNKGGKNVNVFHARYIKEDRAIKESFIFNDGQLSDNSFEGIWVTTQVVEASLDIDFDVLYTELSDMSGLQQRMGRCYRNRILDTENANINVFVGADKIFPSGISKTGKGIIDKDIFFESRKCILKYDNYELDEEEKMKMIDEVYAYDALKSSEYFMKIKDTINNFGKNIEAYELKKSEARLRDISSENIIPEPVYNSNKEYIDLLIQRLKVERDKSRRVLLKDMLMKKTMAVPADYIKKVGGVELELNKFEKLYILPCEYNFDIGLKLKDKEEGFSETQFI